MESPVLLFDGVCGFCNWTVRLLLRHDKRGRLRFAPLQGAYAERIRTKHPELRKIDSLILVETGPREQGQRVWIRSSAALRLAEYLGGRWVLLRVFILIPRPWRDFLYDGFARYRYKVFGRYEQCRMPDSEMRDRFLP